MCGIAGIAAAPGAPAPTRAELSAMIGALHHRGPDGSRLRLDGRVGLAHARLSIIDPEGGWQPIHNPERSVHVVFNGEIFNHVELRAALRRQGHVFYTESDTEVIVHLYDRYGDDFVDHLNGQFAIALHDARRRRLVLARDRVGIRPLYYRLGGDRLAFASEIKALHALGGALALDAQALGEIFGCWSTLGGRSAFAGIAQLPPGHRMSVDLDDPAPAPRIERYWQWRPLGDAGTAVRSEDDLAEELHALLADAVRLQLRADVPVGAYLSGGLDSAAVAALVRRQGDVRLRTFSLAFEQAEFDESRYQRIMAAHLATEHSQVLAGQADIAAAFARAVEHAEAPLLRTAPVPMMLLAGHVRDCGYKVVLTGEGADEVFAGYDLFKEAQARRFLARAPGSQWRGRILERLYPYLAHSPARSRGFAEQFFRQDGDALAQPWFAHLTRIRSTRRVLRFLHPDLRREIERFDPLQALRAQLPDDIGRWPPLDRDQRVEADTLLSGYLLSSQGDRMSMAHSVEGRYPFLDHRVIEFANRLPARHKLRGLREKRLLKRAMRAELPAAILQRHKQPYRAPDSACFFRDGQPLPWVAQCLHPERLRASGLFDAPAIGHLLEKCRSGRAIGFPDNMAFVGVLSLLLLHERFVRAPGGEGGLMLLHRLFAATVQRQPGKLALVCGERRLSYAELDARSRALAGHLRQWGVAPGERVGLLLENGVEMVCALWALLRIGAVCMPFNPQTKADKLGGMLARSGAAMLIAQPSLAPVWRDARRAAPELRRVVVADPDWQGRAGECGWPQGEAFAAASSDAATSPDALAFISHTSGTTGLPKGVMLSHRNLVCAVRAIAQYLAIRQDDVVFSALPLSFNYGLTQFLLACCTGATLVLERSFAFPAQALEIIARERATVFPAVPTMYAMLMAMRDLSRWDLSSLRLATSASAPLPLPLLQQVRARLPTAQLVVMYGQTECTRISYLPPEQLDERPDSVGRGLPGQRCWLIDEDGRRLPWGETGELVVQGDHVMLGYWEDPQRTCEKLFVDPASGRRAMRTGDLFRSDPQGWLYFAGRKDDIIKTRGEKVSPLEVERAIARLPGVRECLVGGVPDDLLGEAIKAWVVPEPGAALGERDVIRHCLASLENHMAPKHVAFVERLPRTATGKPTRQGLS